MGTEYKTSGIRGWYMVLGIESLSKDLDGNRDSIEVRPFPFKQKVIGSNPNTHTHHPTPQPARSVEPGITPGLAGARQTCAYSLCFCSSI